MDTEEFFEREILRCAIKVLASQNGIENSETFAGTQALFWARGIRDDRIADQTFVAATRLDGVNFTQSGKEPWQNR